MGFVRKNMAINNKTININNQVFHVYNSKYVHSAHPKMDEYNN